MICTLPLCGPHQARAHHFRQRGQGAQADQWRNQLKALVHIGAPKAGSTSIQAAISANKASLAQVGIDCYWPSFGPMDRSLSECLEKPGRSRHTQVQQALGAGKDVKAWSEGCWKELEQQVKKSDNDTMLISSEHFFNVPKQEELLRRLDAIFDDYEIIVYLRDAVGQYTSHTDQRIRGGGAKFQDLDSPMEYEFYAYSTFDKMYKHVGADRVHARNFDRSNLLNGDAVQDFFGVISTLVGRELPELILPARSNESLCGAATVWLMTQNETYAPAAPMYLEKRRRLIRRLREDEVLKKLPKLKLDHPDLRHALEYNAREKCAWYNENLLEGQQRLPIQPTPPAPMSKEQSREMLLEWLTSYLTEEATHMVVKVATSASD